MDYRNSDMVWVMVELRAPNGTRSLRGRMRNADYDAILEGTFRKAFFALEDTHWPEQSQGGRIIVVGRDAQWKGLIGTFHLPVRDIITIAPMQNSSDIFLPLDAPEHALSRWEQALLATLQTETQEEPRDPTDPDRTDSPGLHGATDEEPNR
jgi:hypothetical protein